jgi:hypothetical protein
MAEMPDLKRKYGFPLTPEQMIYMDQMRPKSGAEIGQRIIQESSPDLKPPPGNFFQRAATGAGQAADLVNKYLPKALVIPEKYVEPSKLATAVKETEVPTSFKFFPSIDTMTGEMQPAGFGDQRVKVGKVMDAIKPADLLGITSAEKVYGNLGYGQAPEPLDVLDTVGLGAGMTQLGRAGFRGASNVARAGAPYVAEGLTDLVSKYGVDPRMNITPDAPSMSGAVPEGYKLGQENGKAVVFDASGKIFASGNDAQAAIFRANKRLENESANAARTARREERAAEAPVVEAKPEVKIDTESEAPLFYNPLAKAAANLDEKYEFLPTEPTAADEILDHLKSYKDVTDDQILFSGVEDYVRARQSANLPVTKQGVMDYLDKNRIRLYEDYKTDDPGTSNVMPEDLQISRTDLTADDPYDLDTDYHAEYLRDNEYDDIYESIRNRYPELNDAQINSKVDDYIADRAYELAADEYWSSPYYSAENSAGYRIHGNEDIQFAVQSPDGNNLGEFSDLDDANDAIVQHAMNEGITGSYETKFNAREYPQYLMPGGENYRELNIGLRRGSLDKLSGRREVIRDQVMELDSELMALLTKHPIISERSPEIQARIESLRDKKDIRENQLSQMEREPYGWTGNHFDEPDLVAQLRLQDYSDVDGKSGTLVDESQSDLHQKGREQGYRGTEKEIKEADAVASAELAKLTETSKSVPAIFEVYSYTNDIYTDIRNGNFRERLKARIEKRNAAINDEIAQQTRDYRNADRFQDTQQLKEGILAEMNRLESEKTNIDFNDETVNAKLKEIEDQANVLRDAYESQQRLKSNVPDAPFKNNWYHLALRRAIKDAIDHGKDRVYIPSSAAISDRYNYAAAVDEVAYKIKENGNYNVTIKDFDGRWHQNIGNQSFDNLEPKELDSIFGKAVSDRMREKYGDTVNKSQLDPNDTTYVINNQSIGEAIDVGGKGFKVWYDERYPNFLKKEAKEFGATTGNTKIPTPVTSEKVKDKVIRSEARKRRISVREMEEKIRYMDYYERQKFFTERQEPVFYIEINDAMRQAYGKGRPYARGGYVTDALDAVDDHFAGMKEGGVVRMKEGGASEKQEFRAVEPTPILGQLAHLLNTGSEFLKSRPLKEEGDYKTRGMTSAINSVLELADSFFVNDLAKTAERLSYGDRLTSGSGQTLKPLPETTGAVLTVAPPAAKLAAKTAKAAAKVAPEVGETVAQMAERYAMKPSYAVSPADENKFLPLSIPRTRRTPQQIEDAAQRVSRQMTGEHVRNPKDIKKSDNLAGRSMKESERVKNIDYTLEDIKNLPEPAVIEPKVGDVNVATVGDITVSDKVLVDVNGYPINSTQQGGPFFGQGKLDLPDDESLWWASEPTSAKNFQNRVTEIANHYGVDKLTAQHLAMGQTANNFAMHFADANLKAIATYGVPEEGIAAINNAMRQGFSKLKNGERVYFAWPDFPGVENIDEAYKYFRADPEARKWFNERMKTPSVTQPNGLPNGLDIEWAITDPLLRNMEKNLTGRSVGEVYRGSGITNTADHGTYGAGIRGKFTGTSKYPTPMELSYSDAYDYTAARKRPQDITGTMQKIAPHQVVDEQYLDEIGRYNDLIKKYTGKSKGGVVDDDDRIPDMPANPTEADVAQFEKKLKRYNDRDYWKRRGKNSEDQNNSPKRLEGNESYPMRTKVPEQFNKYFMPQYQDEELPSKKAIRYYSKGGKAKITDDYSIAPEAKTGKWSKKDEKSFQSGIRGTKWYKQFVDKYGEPPDLDTKDYNYRAAWKAGVRPQDYEHDAEMQHWASTTGKGESLKATNHPTAWMEDYMQVTGSDPHEPVDMNPEQIKSMEKALMYRYGK